jgi:hypothetical protein
MECGDECVAKALPKVWSKYGPVIVSEYAQTAFGSHPPRVLSISYDSIVCCHCREFRVEGIASFLLCRKQTQNCPYSLI